MAFKKQTKKAPSTNNKSSNGKARGDYNKYLTPGDLPEDGSLVEVTPTGKVRTFQGTDWRGRPTPKVVIEVEFNGEKRDLDINIRTNNLGRMLELVFAGEEVWNVKAQPFDTDDGTKYTIALV